MKPFLTPGGWNEEKCVYRNVSVGLKYVRTSRTELLLNLSPLQMFVSRNVVSVSEISAVNLIVGWCLFACSMNYSISSLFKVQRENMSSIYRFQMSGFNALSFEISVSTLVMKILAKATAIFVPMAVPWVCR